MPSQIRRLFIARQKVLASIPHLIRMRSLALTGFACYMSLMQPRLRTSAGLLGCLLLLSAVICARACDVPVFRYALERWQADRYQAFILHQGALSKTDEALVAELQKSAASAPTPANLEIHSIDLKGSVDAGIRKLWEAQKKAALPWVIITYPPGGNRQGIAWSGPLDGKQIQAVITSPARREIARRLLAGDSVVWVLLESGDASKDQAKATELGGLLKKTEQSLAPWTPAKDASAPVDNAAPDVQLKVKFSVLRLSRTDPAEHEFIQILLNTEQGIDALHEPMTFPVYGQGRVLYAIVGRGINEDNVGQAIAFLTGPCSCEVKAQNPGADLLFAADWSQVAGQAVVTDAAPPPLTGMGAEDSPSGSSKTGSPSPTPSTTTGTETDSAAHGSLARNLGLVLLATAGVVVVAIILIQRRGSRDQRKP